MVNLLFLLSTAWASDVYEVCVHKKQIWNERNQEFVNDYVSTFYSREPIQLIIHDNLFEINRDKRQIVEKFTKEGMDCYREHDNSFICLDQVNNRFLWEFYKRSGEVTRDVLKICSKNGDAI